MVQVQAYIAFASWDLHKTLFLVVPAVPFNSLACKLYVHSLTAVGRELWDSGDQACLCVHLSHMEWVHRNK